RSYGRLELVLEPGVVLVTGPNGAGKTNLLESLHVGTQGFSPRTRSDAQLLRFGEDQGRIALRGTRETSAVAIELTLRSEQGKRATLNGASLRAAGLSSRDALDPWTTQVVELGRALVETRTEVIALLAAPFADCAEQLGLPVTRLAYEGDAPTLEALEAVTVRDLDRGTTGVGP